MRFPVVYQNLDIDERHSLWNTFFHGRYYSLLTFDVNPLLLAKKTFLFQYQQETSKTLKTETDNTLRMCCSLFMLLLQSHNWNKNGMIGCCVTFSTPWILGRLSKCLENLLRIFDFSWSTVLPSRATSFVVPLLYNLEFRRECESSVWPSTNLDFIFLVYYYIFFFCFRQFSCLALCCNLAAALSLQCFLPLSGCVVGCRSRWTSLDLRHQFAQDSLRTSDAYICGIHRLHKGFQHSIPWWLWIVLWKRRRPRMSINLIRFLHEGMQLFVVQGSNTSNVFAVTKGIKQWCVLLVHCFLSILKRFWKLLCRGCRRGWDLHPDATRCWSIQSCPVKSKDAYSEEPSAKDALRWWLCVGCP